MKTFLSLIATSAVTVSAMAFTNPSCGSAKVLLADLQNIDYNIGATNQDLSSISTTSYIGLGAAYRLKKSASKIGDAVTDTYNDCQTGCQFSEEESREMYNYIAGDMYSSTKVLLDNFVAHRDPINESGYTDSVVNALDEIRDRFDSLSSCLVEHWQGDAVNVMKDVKGKVDNAFDTAVAAAQG